MIACAINILNLPKEIYDQFKLLNSYLIIEDKTNSTVSDVSNSAIPSQDSTWLLSDNAEDETKNTYKRQKIS